MTARYLLFSRTRLLDDIVYFSETGQFEAFDWRHQKQIEKRIYRSDGFGRRWRTNFGNPSSQSSFNFGKKAFSVLISKFQRLSKWFKARSDKKKLEKCHGFIIWKYTSLFAIFNTIFRVLFMFERLSFYFDFSANNKQLSVKIQSNCSQNQSNWSQTAVKMQSK